ncbi:TIGR02270 family protein [Haloferula sp. BvORR071]|uniref:TIGR02270 family protein n=1 Tax=Haloferula sp. BvORR071 TaxID=1396141 RepID=UPI00054F3475|nr:TIGR02270 family protein [Haloferula sp. BvORR071]
MQVQRPSIAKIVDQHAEEAAFQWLLRDAAVTSAKHTLLQLGRIDERVTAHLDGLLIAGDAGWQACEEGLAWKEPGEVFAATWLALLPGGHARFDKVLEFAVTDPALSRAFISALGWREWNEVAGRIENLISSRDPVMRRIGLAATAAHRRVSREDLERGLKDEDSTVRQRALRAVAEIGDAKLLPDLRHALSENSEAERFHAARSATLLGDPSSTAELCRQAMAGGRHAEEACSLAMRSLNSADSAPWIARACLDGLSSRAAIKGMGASGDPVHVPWLLERISDPALARIAGEAITSISGLDLVAEEMEGIAPDNFEAGPSDDPDDEGVARDADDELPWPDARKAAQWWQEHGSSFIPARRYLLGRPHSDETLQSTLQTGTQRQRQAASAEQALRHPGRILFNTAAPASRQRAALRSPQ